MPIVTSEIFHVINKPGGRRKLLTRATDDLGKEWAGNFNVPPENDDAATLAAWVADLPAHQAKNEVHQKVRLAKRGKVDSTATYQPQAELDKKAIAEMMQIDDALEFSRTLPWFREFEQRAGANNNARASYLGVTSQQYGLVADRYNQITGIASGIEADRLRVWKLSEGWL